uniref:DDE Tnp4 domain-containing protein n=1 Tax=Timema cristinae TaxID=61476 RepID=A0A7R9GQB6_TIMCR|nr:unnamed protein product [Timema cristinae]
MIDEQLEDESLNIQLVELENTDPNVLGKRLRYGNKSVSPSVPLEEKLLMTCWMLGNTSSYREASKIFNVSKAVVHHIFHHICNELTLLAEKYIRWPTPEECAIITDSFENQFGFPGVVGVIGSCSIRVREPPGNSGNDINGIVLQAVCDDKMLLLDVYTGYPGDTTPAKVLPKSPLYDRLACKNDPLIEPHKHILGNSNYPQLATLLTPYNEDGNQTHSEQELKFNRLHKMACSLIDDSFEILKKRFRRLEYIDVTRVNVANKVILAACVLHNFAILQGDYYSPLMDSGGEVSESVGAGKVIDNKVADTRGQSGRQQTDRHKEMKWTKWSTQTGLCDKQQTGGQNENNYLEGWVGQVADMTWTNC